MENAVRNFVHEVMKINAVDPCLLTAFVAVILLQEQMLTAVLASFLRVFHR